MPQVLAWKCHHTGKLFLDKSEYQAHLRDLATKRYDSRKRKRLKNWSDHMIKTTLRTCATPDMIEEWFLREENWQLIATRMKIGSGFDRINVDKFQFTKFKFERLQWKDKCRNTHYAPQGKPTNFLSRSDIPNGYPGWEGRLTFGYRFADCFSSHLLEGTGIHAGSGGGGESSYSCEVTLFAEEWPIMTVWHKLQN